MIEYYLFYQVPSWVGTGDRSRFEQSMRDGLAGLQYNVFRDADFNQIYETIRADVDSYVTQSGTRQNFKRILLLAHSQGNLYANAVYEKLVNQTKIVAARAIRYYGIAPATAYQAGTGSRYILSDKDVVINALRLPFQVLANNANVSWVNVVTSALASSLEVDWRRVSAQIQGHSLTEVYLKSGFGMRSRIASDLRTLVGQLKARAPDSFEWGSWGPGKQGYPDLKYNFNYAGGYTYHRAYVSGADSSFCPGGDYYYWKGCKYGTVNDAVSLIKGRHLFCLNQAKEWLKQGREFWQDVRYALEDIGCSQAHGEAAITGYSKFNVVLNGPLSPEPEVFGVNPSAIYSSTFVYVNFYPLCE